MRPTSVLATVTGRDRPGVTAAFFAALAAHDVDVRDVEQVVIRDRLILSVLFDLRGDSAALRNSIARSAGALGMECEIAVDDDADRAGSVLFADTHGSRSHVIVLGHPLRPGAVGHVAQRSPTPAATSRRSPSSGPDRCRRSSWSCGPRRRRRAAERARRGRRRQPASTSRSSTCGLRRRAKRLVAVGLHLLVEAPDAARAAGRAARDGGAVRGAGRACCRGRARPRRRRCARAPACWRVCRPTSSSWSARGPARRRAPSSSSRTLRRFGYHVGAVSGRHRRRGGTACVAELGLDFDRRQRAGDRRRRPDRRPRRRRGRRHDQRGRGDPLRPGAVGAPVADRRRSATAATTATARGGRARASAVTARPGTCPSSTTCCSCSGSPATSRPRLSTARAALGDHRDLASAGSARRSGRAGTPATSPRRRSWCA